MTDEQRWQACMRLKEIQHRALELGKEVASAEGVNTEINSWAALTALLIAMASEIAEEVLSAIEVEADEVASREQINGV